ncbi:MAG TPA: MlaD family protein [Mycobacterium sp.]|uniref:MCE family protein n=1 Tax=Mycolicibacterium sp. TaxID=2320850 RepID=UPI0025DF6526|nr:MlaD family protein [Mycolicibacterium sp.]HPX36679.1 MlaD family protein [Mycobacterium sp.]HQC76405.1 MlaD family protein [Mycobacterium sp.]
MSIKGTAIKLALFSFVLLLCTALLIVVFGQLRFQRYNHYTAEFSNGSGVKGGDFIRAGGVEVGKVADVRLTENGQRVIIDMKVDRSLPLYQSSTAQIRYANLIGDRFVNLERGTGEGADRVLPPGGFIPVARTQPALDLDALIGGFKPLFKSLDPEKVNNIASSLVTVFQGQGGTVADILRQTGELTSTLADRDKAIGEVITNLNTVLTTVNKHQKAFDSTVNDFEVLITGLKNRADPLATAVADISTASGTLAGLLSDNRPQLQSTLTNLETVQSAFADNPDKLEKLISEYPPAINLIGRVGGIYGDFFNFYLCDLTLTLNGLQPGGPVREVRITKQPTGRCTPQ